MADVTLTYKGDTIAELSESGSKTLETAGKYCEADILLEYEKSGGSVGGLTYSTITITPTETIGAASDGGYPKLETYIKNILSSQPIAPAFFRMTSNETVSEPYFLLDLIGCYKDASVAVIGSLYRTDGSLNAQLLPLNNRTLSYSVKISPNYTYNLEMWFD